MSFRPVRNISVVLGVGLVAGLMGACGSDQGIERYKAGGGLQDSERNSDDVTAAGLSLGAKITPPRAYYEALLAETLKQVDQDSFNLAVAGADPVLWINFDGGSIARGLGRGESFLVCSGIANIPASGFSPSERALIAQGVEDAYRNANRSVLVMLDRPEARPYTTIHVAGSPADIGCANDGALGLAPFDRLNANHNDVAFVFTRDIVAADVTEAVIHNYGLTLGLSATESGPRAQERLSLSDAAAVPSQEPVTGISVLPGSLTNLPGLTQIGLIAQLLSSLDSQNLVDISKLSPLLQSIVPGATGQLNLNGLDKILTIVGLASQAAAHQHGGATPAPSPTPTPTPTPASGQGGQALPIDIGLVLALLNAQNAQMILNITTLVALGGFGDISVAVMAVQNALNMINILLPSIGQIPPVLGGGTGSQQRPTPTPTPMPTPLPTSSVATLPDLSQLLGLSKSISDYATLITNLAATAQVINSNFQGADRDALLSMLKVAYSQFFQQLSATQGAP